MDLSSELGQAGTVTKELDETSFTFTGLEDGLIEEFCQALLVCSRNISHDQQLHHTLYKDQYILTAFDKGTVTPLSRIVGPHQQRAVFVTSCPEGPQQPILQESPDMTTPTLYKAPFNMAVHSQVSISHVLKQQKVYLTQKQSHPLEISLLSIAMDTDVKPLQLHLANYFCSCYAIWCRGNVSLEEAPELWIPCSKNTKNIIALGCSINTDKLSGQSTLILYRIQERKSLLIDPNQPYSIKPKTLLPTQKNSSSKQLQNRLVWMTSLYQFGPCVDETSEHLNSQLAIEFIWQGVDAVFSPPPNTADVVLSVQATPGFQYSPVYNVYKEMESLLEFCKVASAVSSWSLSDEENILESPTSITSKTAGFLEEASTQMLRAFEVSILSPAIECSPFQPREDLDFVGQLWMFAKHAADPTDLVDTLGLVFTAVLLGRTQPYIHHNKSSTLANLFRQALSAKSNDERQVVASKLQLLLIEEKAIHCLAEIGLEKMQRDYVIYFTSNGLATQSEVEVFFSSDGTILDRCQRLCHLHCVLELAAVLLTFVTLPKASVSTFVKKALDYYQHVKSEEFTTTPTFHIPFTSLSTELKSLATFATSLPPSFMSATLDRENELSQRQVVYCMNESIFKYLYSFNSSTVDQEENEMYVYHASCESVPL